MEKCCNQYFTNKRAFKRKSKSDEIYIRPIILFQAENKSGIITVDVLKKELIKPKYSRKIIHYLTTHKALELNKPILNKYALVKAIKEKIDNYGNQAYKAAFQQSLDLLNIGEDIFTIDLSHHSLNFLIQYPPSRLYTGNYHFNKHYHKHLIAHRNKEEVECAKAIDLIIAMLSFGLKI